MYVLLSLTISLENIKRLRKDTIERIFIAVYTHMNNNPRIHPWMTALAKYGDFKKINSWFSGGERFDTSTCQCSIASLVRVLGNVYIAPGTKESGKADRENRVILNAIEVIVDNIPSALLPRHKERFASAE
jgi:hypothetical protein